MNKLFLTLAISLVAAMGAFAQNPIGTWKTIDDKTSEEKSHIEIYQNDGKFYGKIVELLRSEPGVLCDQCSGKKKDQPVLGMVILEELEPYDDYWKEGTILDPENGSTYSCSIWFDDGNTDELKVRGKHWTGLYRTQTWYRVK